MPLQGLAGKLLVPGRDDQAQRVTQDVSIRNPGADVGPGSQPYVDAQVLADTTTVIFADAVTIANDATRQTRTGDQLDADGEELGVPRNQPIGASGAVIVSAGPSGTTIVAGDVITINGFKYRCAATALYEAGNNCPISALSTGSATDQAPGTSGNWSAPRPGCNATAVVFQQADGSGLSGGAEEESDDDYRVRLDEAAANPASAGNDAQYQLLVTKTPTVPVQQGFTFPDIMGPGSTCILFTLRPSQPGASRIPNATQIAAVKAWVAGQVPADDGQFWGTIVPNPVNVNLLIAWAQGADGWVDQQPWPPYVSGSEVAINGTLPATPTSFYLTGNTGGALAPAPGQTIAVFDIANLTFQPKKILTVTSSGTNWLVTIDTTSGVSDTRYTPFGGQIVCPWSASLQSLVIPLLSYFDTLGPGEQLSDANLIDPGLRQRRSPPDPSSWPSRLSNRVVLPIFGITSVEDVELLDPTIPYDAPIGTPGVASFMTTLLNLAAFPEST